MNIEQILEKEFRIADFFSVVKGFRDIGTISVSKHLSELRTFVADKYSDYTLTKAWSDDIYFIHHKVQLGEVLYFNSEYPNPIQSKEGEKELGLILGFPSCCVYAHIDDCLEYEDEECTILPFAPCSKECARLWIESYKYLDLIQNKTNL